MSNAPLAIPHLQACAWFEEAPADSSLTEGAEGFLDVSWGKPDVAFVEPLLRRRLSRMARGFFHCAQRLSPPGEVRVVHGSRHGEADRTLALLQDLAAQRELSPTVFSMSVHNAVPGLWSIFKGNHAPITAVAAGEATFGWALVEASAAWQADPGTPVLCLYAEDRLPEPWAAGEPQQGLHVVALLLGGNEGPGCTLSREPGDGGPPSALSQARHFLEAWRGGGAVWTGAGNVWHWQFY
jgi:hypothetical protein